MHEEIHKPYRVILYGAGGYLRDRENEILRLPDTCIIGIADSSDDAIGLEWLNFVVMAPSSLCNLNYDYIVVTSTYASEIKYSLIEKGIDSKRILNYLEYKWLVSNAGITHYGGDIDFAECADSVLIITRHLDFTGSTMAAYYATIALAKNNIAVSIAAASYDEPFLDFLVEKGVDVWIVEGLEWGGNRPCEFMNNYRHIILNTYWMHHCINMFDSSFDVILWLHDPEHVYEKRIRFWGALQERFDNVRVYGVSQKACDNFNIYYPSVNTSILEYGIPDEYKKTDTFHMASNRCVIAIIGAIYDIKGQDIFLDAVDKMDEETREKCEFWIIGKVINEEYGKSIIERSKGKRNVFMIGELSHEELMSKYRDINIVVSASREDMLPIVIVEAMMMGKNCIIPKSIGISAYVSDERVLTQYEAGNASDLCDKLTNIISNSQSGENNYSREFYKRLFSMEAFSKRLKSVMDYD